MNYFSAFISGLVEGEGCFCVSFSQRKKMTLGIEVRPSFSISQNKRNLVLLQKINTFFGCGAIRLSKRDRTYKYEVRSVENLVKIIIPHFESNPLCGIKQNEFLRFKEIIKIIHRNHHLNPNGMKQIIHLAYQLNESGKRKFNQMELLRLLDKMMI